MSVFLVTTVLITSIVVCAALSRASFATGLFALTCLTLFCTYGFMASFEPGAGLAFRVVYALGAVGSIAAGCRMIQKKTSTSSAALSD